MVAPNARPAQGQQEHDPADRRVCLDLGKLPGVDDQKAIADRYQGARSDPVIKTPCQYGGDRASNGHRDQDHPGLESGLASQELQVDG